MIVVKIELHSAITHDVTEIGRAYITNDGTGSGELGNYDVAVCRRGYPDLPAPLNPTGTPAVRRGRVEGYPRLAFNVWRLIARAVTAAFPEERTNARKAKNATPILDAVTVAGLRVVNEIVEDLPRGVSAQIGANPNVQAARAWLAAADAELEPSAEDASHEAL